MRKSAGKKFNLEALKIQEVKIEKHRCSNFIIVATYKINEHKLF